MSSGRTSITFNLTRTVPVLNCDRCHAAVYEPSLARAPADATVLDELRKHGVLVEGAEGWLRLHCEGGPIGRDYCVGCTPVVSAALDALRLPVPANAPAVDVKPRGWVPDTIGRGREPDFLP